MVILALALAVQTPIVAEEHSAMFDVPGESAASVEVFPLRPNLEFERVIVRPDGSVESNPAFPAAGEGNEKLVYSNTLGLLAAQFSANGLVADDITLQAGPECRLTRYEFQVMGKANPTGVGGPFSVTFALYSYCPQALPTASRPGLILPGSGTTVNFPDEAPRTIVVDLPDDFDSGSAFHDLAWRHIFPCQCGGDHRHTGPRWIFDECV